MVPVFSLFTVQWPSDFAAVWYKVFLISPSSSFKWDLWIVKGSRKAQMLPKTRTKSVYCESLWLRLLFRLWILEVVFLQRLKPMRNDLEAGRCMVALLAARRRRRWRWPPILACLSSLIWVCIESHLHCY